MLAGIHTTVFRLTLAGDFTALHTLTYSVFPTSAPTQTADGLIRGVLTHIGGTTQTAMFAIEPSGANYQEIPLFYPFTGSAVEFMAQPSDGNLWGVLGESIVSFTLSALLKQASYTGTGSPAVLLQASHGTLVGLGTSESLGQGELGDGPVEIFTVDPGLSAPAPLFVHSRQSAGRVGSQVMIQGSNFVGATAVLLYRATHRLTILNGM
jgi:hypothetical protein